MKKRYTRTHNPTPWTEAELTKFGEAVTLHILRIADLVALTGLAGADAFKATKANLEADQLAIKRTKSGQPTYIFIGPELQGFFEETPKDQYTLLVNKEGKPYRTADALGKDFD